MRTHLQAAAVLAASLGVPGIRLGRRQAGPAAIEEEVGGQPTTILRPLEPPPWPSVWFANGATPDGRAHPTVRRLAGALARSGFAVYIPDLPGVSQGFLIPSTLAAAVESASSIVEAPETADGRVGLVGVSVGGTLALLVAADPGLAARISVVACIAPFTDLERVIQLATTGTYRSDDSSEPRPYPVPAELAAGLARSLRELPGGEGDEAVAELLASADPARFDELYLRLPASVRQAARELSPRYSIDRVQAPVEIATAPQDRYFPTDESLALCGHPGVRVTVTAALAHARPQLRLRELPGLVQLERFFARALGAIRGPGSRASTRPLRRGGSG